MKKAERFRPAWKDNLVCIKLGVRFVMEIRSGFVSARAWFRLSLIVLRTDRIASFPQSVGQWSGPLFAPFR